MNPVNLIVLSVGSDGKVNATQQEVTTMIQQAYQIGYNAGLAQANASAQPN